MTDSCCLRTPRLATASVTALLAAGSSPGKSTPAAGGLSQDPRDLDAQLRAPGDVG